MLAAGSVAAAQELDPGVRRPFLRPAAAPVLATTAPSIYAGAFLGVQRNWSNGRFTTNCDCGYADGSGYSPALGALLEYSVSAAFLLSGEVRYAEYSTSYATRETRSEFLVSRGSYMAVDFERDAAITLSQLSIGAFAAWRTGLGGVFLFAGPRFGILLKGSIAESERVLSPGLGYASTGSADKAFAQGDLNLVGNKNSLRVEAVAGIGADIPLRRSLKLSPRLAYAYPFTSVVKEHSSWIIPALDFNLALLFAL